MNSQKYILNSELDKGLKKYGEDNNLSPLSIVEELVEDFLIKKGYFTINITMEPKGEQPIEKIKYAGYESKKERYQIKKHINGIQYNYGSITQGASLTKELVTFLESVDWDTKYSTKETGLKGTAQINFLLNEMEKVKK